MRTDEIALMEQVLEQLSGLPESVRQTITDHLWATIPTYITEAGYQPNMAPGELTVAPQTAGYEVIRAVTAFVAPTGTGVITLGSIRIPVAAGMTNLTNLSIVLATSDVRKLTTATATGPAALLLCGDQLPVAGFMAP